MLTPIALLKEKIETTSLSVLLFTVVGVLLLKLHNHLPAVNAIPLDTSITILWLENWQVNITLVAIGICCLCLSKPIADKMEALKKTADNKQLMKDYLTWKED